MPPFGTLSSLILRDRYFLYVLLLPLIYFITFLVSNSFLFTMDYQEMDDLAANALQIRRAAEFREFLGPYSRSQFHHFGPINYYYYALMELPLFFVNSVHGQHVIAQLLLNFIFCIAALSIVYTGVKEKWHTILFFLLIVFVYSSMGNHFWVSNWGPFIIVFPMLLFAVASARLAGGELKFLPVLTLAAPFIYHNHIGGFSLIVPLTIIALFLAHKNQPAGKHLFDNGNTKYFVYAFLIILITSLPSLYEEFAYEDGNISRILGFIASNKSYAKATRALDYIFQFYAEPWRLNGVIPNVIFFILTVALAARYLKKGSYPFYRYLAIISCWAVLFSIMGTFKLVGGFLKFIFNNHLSYVIIFLFLSLTVIAEKIKLSERIKPLLFPATATLLLLLTLIFSRFSLPYQDDVDRFVSAIKPKPEQSYKIAWDFEQNLGQWVMGTGLALGLERQGYRTCVEKAWGFMFPRDLVCQTGEKTITLKLETIENRPEFLRLDENRFEYHRTRLTIVSE